MVLRDLLAEYNALPEYLGMELTDVNQISLFGDSPLHVAAVRGSIAEMEVLVLARADVNAAGEHGYTPLHSAVEQGSGPATHWLLEHGADPSRLTDSGFTAMVLAVELGEMELAALLETGERRWSAAT